MFWKQVLRAIAVGVALPGMLLSLVEPEEPVTAEPVPEEPTETRPWWYYENWWPWRGILRQ